jgi:flagellar protein FlaF
MRTEVVGMGFSVSGTYALLFFGVLFAMGTLHASASNAVEEVRDAQQVQNDHLSAIQRTDVNVTDVILLDATSCDVNVTANNTGTTQLRVSETDLFSDGTYEENLTDRAQVDGTDGTDLWLPGQQLEVDAGEFLSAPDRVKVVTGPGVSDTAEASGLVC